MHKDIDYCINFNYENKQTELPKGIISIVQYLHKWNVVKSFISRVRSIHNDTEDLQDVL